MSHGEYSYQEIADEIGKSIRSGKYQPGARCPSLTQIMRRYAVSRVTASHAVDELKKRGLVSSRRGRGTFVSSAARRAIGIIVPGFNFVEIFPPICREFARLAQQKDMMLLYGEIASTDPGKRAELAKQVAHKFVDERVSGIMFQPLEHIENAERLNREILAIFDAERIPVVLVDCDYVRYPESGDYDVVGIDNFKAGFRLARHLTARGIRKLGFVFGPNSAVSVQDRFLGAQAAVANSAASISALNLDPSDSAAVRRVIAKRFGAIICRNDHLAAHLLSTLRTLGVRVPEDVLVAGFSDTPYAALLEPSLTTVRLPCEDIARLAFALLCSRMENPSLLPRTCHVPGVLIERKSSSCEGRSVKIKRRGKAK